MVRQVRLGCSLFLFRLLLLSSVLVGVTSVRAVLAYTDIGYCTDAQETFATLRPLFAAAHRAAGTAGERPAWELAARKVDSTIFEVQECLAATLAVGGRTQAHMDILAALTPMQADARRALMLLDKREAAQEQLRQTDVKIKQLREQLLSLCAHPTPLSPLAHACTAAQPQLQQGTPAAAAPPAR